MTSPTKDSRSMNKVTGRLLMATAIGHAFVGFVLFRESIAAILNDGFVNAIHPPLYAAEPRFDRIAVFWFLLFSPVLFLLGQITNRAVERREAHILKLIGWNLMGIGVLGSVVLPVSGNWILIALAATVLRAASGARKSAAQPAAAPDGGVARSAEASEDLPRRG